MNSNDEKENLDSEVKTNESKIISDKITKSNDETASTGSNRL